MARGKQIAWIFDSRKRGEEYLESVGTDSDEEEGTGIMGQHLAVPHQFTEEVRPEEMGMHQLKEEDGRGTTPPTRVRISVPRESRANRRSATQV